MRRGMLVGLVAGLGATLPALADAQFLYRLHLSNVGGTTCTTTGASTAITGDYDWILPPTSGNLRLIRAVNGIPVDTQVVSITPFNVDNDPATTAAITLPVATPLPYTATLDAMPFSNGAAVDTGFRATWTCDGAGGGTFGVVAIFIPPVVPVPASSAPALATLAALLALAGVATARRRRRPVR